MQRNNRTLAFLFLCLCFSFSFFTKAQTTAISEEKKVPKVAMLGMFHFGKTTDIASIKIENLLGEQRQQEILSLIDYLALYKPTKILVEYPFEMTDSINARYQKYLEGKFAMTANEIYQIGFRLAKKMEHQKVYGIDHQMDLPFEALMLFCQENNQMDAMQKFISEIQEYTAAETVELAHTRLSTFLRDRNSDTADQRMNRVYVQDMLAYGNLKNEVGVELTAAWYKRNLMMLNNISRTIDSPEDRILVIVGAAHRAMMKDFILTRDDMQYVEIGDYLK